MGWESRINGRIWVYQRGGLNNWKVWEYGSMGGEGGGRGLQRLNR